MYLNLSHMKYDYVMLEMDNIGCLLYTSRRLELNLTQPYVAEKMGVTASTILRYENGSIDNTKKMVLEGLSAVSYTHLDVYKRQA